MNQNTAQWKTKLLVLRRLTNHQKGLKVQYKVRYKDDNDKWMAVLCYIFKAAKIS